MLKLEAIVNGMTKMKNEQNFFLNLEKKRSIKALIRKLEKKWKINCDQANIYDEIKTLFEEVFKGKSFTNLSNIQNTIDLSSLPNEQNVFCEIKLRKKELFIALKSMQGMMDEPIKCQYC